jgi:rRNA processing protein Gar1
MQNNEHRLHITTSNEYPDRDSSYQDHLQTEPVEYKILPMADGEDQIGQITSSGHPTNNLPNDEDIPFSNTEGLTVYTDTRPMTIKQTADELLDEVTFSDEEMEIQPNITNEVYNTEMKKITELYEETDATLNKYTGTKHEADEVREIPEAFEVQSGQTMNECGCVDDIVESDKVIVKVNLYNGILDLDNIMFTANKIPFGYIDDVIGKVEEPYYVVRFFPTFMDKSIICKGHMIYYVNQKAKTIQTRQLLKKGCDASNAFDEEISEDEMEFSDDDEEVERKKQKVN